MCLPPDTCIHLQTVQLGSDTSSSLLSKGASLSHLKNALPCSSCSLLQTSTSFNPIPWAAGPGLTSVAMNAGRCFLTRGFSAASTLGHAAAGRAQPLVKGLLSLTYPESSVNPNHSSYLIGEKKKKIIIIIMIMLYMSKQPISNIRTVGACMLHSRGNI